MVNDANAGRIGRRAFLQRAGLLDLFTGLIGTLLAACGDDDTANTTVTITATTGAGGGGASDLAAISALVYPGGFTSDDLCNGPDGGAKVGFLLDEVFSGMDEFGSPSGTSTTLQQLGSRSPLQVGLRPLQRRAGPLDRDDRPVPTHCRAARTRARHVRQQLRGHHAITNTDLIASGGYDDPIWVQIFPDVDTTVERWMQEAGITTTYLAVGTSEEDVIRPRGGAR